jgi:flagellar protein FliO/FliZ
MYVVKKLKLAKYTQNKHIKVINSVPVGGKEKILLLEVNNTYLLIGATPNSIETLYVFDQLQQPQTVDSKDTAKKTFADQMKAEQYEICQD